MAVDGPGSGQGSNGGYSVSKNRPMGPTVVGGAAPGGLPTAADGVDPGLIGALNQIMGDETSSSPGSNLQNVVLLPTGGGWYSAGRGGMKNQPYSESQAAAYFLRMTEAEKRQLNQAFNRFGKTYFETPKSMWAAYTTASINTGYTPWQIMDMDAAKGAAPGPGPGGGGSRGGGGGSAGGPFSTVDTNLTNEFDARTLVDNALNTYLGRNASEKERARFWKMLNKQEAANPQVSAGVTGSGSRQSVSSGGFSREQFAEDFAKSRKNYAEVQASTTLMGWMNSALAADTRMI